MKSKKISLFLLVGILSIIFLAACNNDDSKNTPDNPQVEETKKAITLDVRTLQSISEVVTEGHELTFEKNTPKELLPKVNTIITAPITEKTPHGFLGKVIKIEERSDKIVVITERVALNEAFPNLSIDTVINVLDNFQGIFDADGNPLEYTIEDNPDAKVSRADNPIDFDWGSKRINVPIPKKLFGIGFELSGNAFLTFKGSKIDLDTKGKFNYLNFDISVRTTVDSEITAKLKNASKDFEKGLFEARFIATAGPVIIPITIPISLKSGMEGNISTKIQLHYSTGIRTFITYKNKKWDQGTQLLENTSKNPWAILEFDVNGEIYAGLNGQIKAGVFTDNLGVGFETFPKLSLKSNVNYSTLNPFKINPDVEMGGYISSNVFCEASLFDHTWDAFRIKLPNIDLFSTTVSLLPNISNFTATGGSSQGEISWQNDSFYFLEPLGVKTGSVVYSSDKTTEINRYYPRYISINKNSQRLYNANVYGLKSGQSYYAAPIISWLDHEWIGDLHEFTTEANYNLGSRCVGQTYDAINFNFSLNDLSQNTLDLTTEAQDYDGSAMRIRLQAKYDAQTKTLNGTFDFFFYDDPSQRRKDGFSIRLDTEDSGYVNCSKIINNGGCYTALRIFKNNNSQAAKKRYNKPLMEDGCNEGFYNNNYQRQ